MHFVMIEIGRGEGGVGRDILVYHSPVSWVLQWWHGIEKGSFQGKRKF